LCAAVNTCSLFPPPKTLDLKWRALNHKRSAVYDELSVVCVSPLATGGVGGARRVRGDDAGALVGEQASSAAEKKVPRRHRRNNRKDAAFRRSRHVNHTLTRP
jgi:hypothetical protein